MSATPAAEPTTTTAPPATPAATAPQAKLGADSVLTTPPPAKTEGAPAEAAKDPKGSTPTAEGEKAKATEPAPTADIKVTLPEGMQAGPALEKFLPLAKELGLKQDGAQKLVDLYTEAAKSLIADREAVQLQRHQEWRKAVESDKELGGKNLPTTIAHAQRAVEFAGGAELKAALNELGIGNHPVLVRAFAKFGAALGEDTVSGTSSTTAPAVNDQEALYRSMYPTMFAKKDE